jgi:hypothetical protein
VIFVDTNLTLTTDPQPAASPAWDAIRARSEVKRDGFVAVCAHCVRTFELVALPCDTHSTSEERTEREQRLEAASGGAA